MNDPLSIDIGKLVDEITRYLAVVSAFRAAGSEPSWRAESAPVEPAVPLETTPATLPSDLRRLH